MAAPLTLGQATDLVDLSIQNLWLKSSDPKVQYKSYFNFRTTEDYYEKDSGLSGLGEASFIDENAVIVSDVPVQTYDKTYTQTMVGTILPITQKMLISSISWIEISLYKLLKLRETLYETIRSEIQKWRRSETIIEASFGMMG